MSDIEKQINIIKKLIAGSKTRLQKVKSRDNFNPITDDHIIVGCEKEITALEKHLIHLKLRMIQCD